jgi:hypothetical protein
LSCTNRQTTLRQIGGKEGRTLATFYDPEGVLIDWKDGPGWTTTSALAGTLVTGSIGSGKSSGPGALLRRVFLRSTKALPGGMGGMVFFAKNGECDEWVKVCKQNGRGDDLIRVTPGGPYKFNFMDWIAQFGGSDERGPIPTVALLEEIASAVSPQGAGAGGNENAFFESAHRTLLTNLVHVCQLSGLPVSLPLMRSIVGSTPQTVAQGKDPVWRKESACWQILREARARTWNDEAAGKDFEECRDYFMNDWAMLSDRTRGILLIMFTNLARPFLTRPLRPIFCEGSNIRPEMMFDGAIFLIDIPVQEYHLTAKLAALAFKRTAQLAIMRRSGPPGSLRPVFIFADEAQNFLSPKDTEYQAVARSAGGVTCLLTQQISSVREALGSEDKAENLISNLQTKFACQNSGDTARYMSTLIGERYTQITGINIGHSAPNDPQVPGQGGTSGGINRNEQKRSYIEPAAFQKLRRGGKSNGMIVDTVVFAGGKMFAGDTEPVPFKILSFRQE